MKDFLLLLGWLSLAGSLLGLAVAAVGRLSKGRLSRAFCCGLWFLVLLRLVLPFGLPEPLRELGFLAQVSAGVQRAEQTAAAQRNAIPGATLNAWLAEEETQRFYAGIAALATGGGTDAPTPPAAESGAADSSTISSSKTSSDDPESTGTADPLETLTVTLFHIWLSVAIFRLAWLIYSYRAFRRQVLRFASPAPLESRISFASFTSDPNVRLVCSPAVHAALLLGVKYPVVVLPCRLPEGVRGDTAIRTVIQHELTHYRRGDLRLKWFAAVVGCLHWFNPLVWLLQKELDRACELACDEAVIRTMDAQEKQLYGETLIAFAGRQSSPAVPLTAICEEKRRLKERLVHIMRYKKRSAVSVIVCCLLAVLLCGSAAALGPLEENAALPAGKPLFGSVETNLRIRTAQLRDNAVIHATLERKGTPLADCMDVCFSDFVLADETLWFAGYRADEADPTAVTYCLAAVTTEGRLQQSLPLTLPTPETARALQEGEWLRSDFTTLVDTGGSRPALLWEITHIGLSADGSHTAALHREYRLSEFDANGTVTDGIRLDIAPTEGQSLRYLCAAPGSLWLELQTVDAAGDSRRLLGFSAADGSLLADIRLPTNMSVCAAQALTDNQLVVQVCMGISTQGSFIPDHDTSLFYVLDLNARVLTLGRPVMIPGQLRYRGVVQLLTQPLCALSATAPLWSNDGLYLLNPSIPTLTQKYEWLSFGGGEVWDTDALYLPDGRYFFRRQNDGIAASGTELACVRPTDGFAASGDGRTILSVGVTDAAALTDAVKAFNASNPDYRVVLVTYTDADAANAGLSNAHQLLEQELLYGSVPDIVVLPNGMDLARIPVKNLFFNLNWMIDHDPEFSREDFVTGALEACETDGRLTTVMPFFSLSTAAGSTAALGAQPGLSWADFTAAAAGKAAPINGLDRLTALWWQVQAGGRDFIDYDTGKAYFDSDAFRRLLESTAAYPAQQPADPGAAAFSAREHLLQYLYILDFGDIPALTALFGDTPSFKGVPSDNGSGSLFIPGMRVGITARSAKRDGAWQFVRTLLLPEYQNSIRNYSNFRLPLRRDALAALAAEYRQPRDAAYTPVYLGGRAADTGRSLTRTETDRLLELAEATDTLFVFNSTVLNILAEEAGKYYDGLYTAEEAAAAIQSRAQRYLDGDA